MSDQEQLAAVQASLRKLEEEVANLSGRVEKLDGKGAPPEPKAASADVPAELDDVIHVMRSLKFVVQAVSSVWDDLMGGVSPQTKTGLTPVKAQLDYLKGLLDHFFS